ncbi:hypothetical protein PAXRUDRAFT_131000 [Paxillus rubicundulus Ve08.2h10]|uniref:Uncharacterized protein n=1 Tax=Paxillus rubicundulus Ve08.2h10 TaxID=930991 RepID=A0A0D0DMK5_9AGAM|nr:hypothetical protein PAXRUDRAFT_131000 [Paxillus rubicundulus Ve08.2h10]
MPSVQYPTGYRYSPVPSTFTSSPLPSLISLSRQPSLTSRSGSPSTFANNVLAPRWTEADQAQFGAWLAHITASCGFPFTWVEDAKWLGFCQEFIPAAQPIKHQSLADWWIPAEAAKFRCEAKESAHGLEGMLQCDGWSGINFHHFIAFMMTTLKREVHLIKIKLLTPLN